MPGWQVRFDRIRPGGTYFTDNTLYLIHSFSFRVLFGGHFRLMHVILARVIVLI